MINPNDVSFQIDVSREFKNKAGYEAGGLNRSFKTETHTPETLKASVITQGWPYTMAHQKREPGETGADERDVTTPKHSENFTSLQVLTCDDDSAQANVARTWLKDDFFKDHGWAFVRSVSSKPGKEKGHPTFIFDQPLTDINLVNECLDALCWRYPQLDHSVDATNTIFNNDCAVIHEIGNICEFATFKYKILTPYREYNAKIQAAYKAKLKKSKADYEKAIAAGTVKNDGADRHNQYWAQAVKTAVGMVESSRDGDKHVQLRNASRLLGGYIAGGMGDELSAIEVLESAIRSKANVANMHAAENTIKRNIKCGASTPITYEQKEQDRIVYLASLPRTGFEKPQEVDVILQQIADLRESRNEYWTRGEDPPDLYEQVKEAIRQTGHLNGTDIEKVLVEVERKPAPLAEKCRTELRQIWQAARKFVQSGGVFVVRPERTETWPYDVKGGRLVYLTERIFYDAVTIQQMPVADFHARIVSQITNEDKTRTFLVKGKAVRGGPFQFEMDAEEFGNDRKLKAVIDAASGALDPVRAGMGKHLTAALQLLAGDDMTQYKRYRRTGWADGQFLIPGREPDGVLIEIKDDIPPFRIGKEADLPMGLDALRALLKSMIPERTTPICSLIFQAPLSKIVKWENERYAVFITGRTGSLKTSFAQCLMCIYGAGFIKDEKIIKWGDGATQNALVNLTTIANDMPLLIDNYKPGTGGGARAFISLIHNILEGADKYRLNRASKLRDTKPIHCWPLCTGEDVPDSDPASLARILIMPFLWQNGEDNANLTKAQTFSEHLSAIGGAWLTWLETKDGRQTATRIAVKFPQYRSRWSKELKGIRTDTVNSLRVASNLATNELTWEILCEHPTIGPVAREFKEAHLTGLKTIVAITMAEATAEALEATRYLAAIKELVATEQVLIPGINEVVLSGLKDRVIGYKDSKGVYIFSKIARRAVERLLSDNLNGVSQIALHKQLAGQGLIESHGEGTLLKIKWINGKTVKVLHLKMSALEEVLVEAKEPEPEQIPF